MMNIEVPKTADDQREISATKPKGSAGTFLELAAFTLKAGLAEKKRTASVPNTSLSNTGDSLCGFTEGACPIIGSAVQAPCATSTVTIMPGFI